ALDRAPVTGDDDSVGELQRQDCGAMRRGNVARRLLAGRVGAGIGSVRRSPKQIHEARVATQRIREIGRPGQAPEGICRHSPPFCTYDLTNSSAFSSRTESISSRISSISSLSFSPFSLEVACPASSPPSPPPFR